MGQETGDKVGVEVRHRTKLAVVVGAVAMILASGTTAYAATDTDDVVEYEVPVIQPAHVVWHAPTKSYFTGGAFTGKLARGNLDEDKAGAYLPADPVDRREAFGLMIDDKDRLYVAGGTTGNVYVYDIHTKEEVARYDTGGITFPINTALAGVPPMGGLLPVPQINDVALSPDGEDVYFTDSFRPFIYRTSDDGETIEKFPLTPEVDYAPGVNANGIRITEDGKYALFGDFNDNKLYRMTLPDDPADRQIDEVELTGGPNGGPPVLGPGMDGIEFRDADTLYIVNIVAETVSKVELSKDYLSGEVVSETTSPEFQSPSAAAYVEETDQLLISNSELVDPSEPGPPYFVTAIPAP